ncbi:MAG: dihydropteroate synthase [Saprospiraceae bacterium]|nr:dihydropteroate synthase [Saprospiraceae bacterium]
MNGNVLKGGDLLVDLSLPKVMGIINLTEDSFYKESRFTDEILVLKKVEEMVNAGADMIDIGAMSSRPGAKLSNPDQESKTIAGYMKTIRRNFPSLFVSIDTVYGVVANSALYEGANMINDISAGNIDGSIWDIVSSFQAPYVLMHMRGLPENMQNNTLYDDIMSEMLVFFKDKIRKLKERGIYQIVIDPGIGFSKDIDSNFLLLRNLESFSVLEYPILLGMSRKGFIYKTLHTSPENSLNGTSVLHAVALLNGAKILRVHDVKEAKEAVTLIEMLKKG